MENKEKIIKALPYGSNFCFVDKITKVDNHSITGKYTFKKNSFFYDSHFINKAFVPGVLMIEAMGQIGMVCHLIYLTNNYNFDFLPILSNLEVEFYGNSNYEEELTVIGEKIYFRHNILKSQVEMRKADKSIIAQLTANIKII